jgi:hypothetical protein
MKIIRSSIGAAATGTALILMVASCADPTYDERIAYLNTVSAKGAEMHALIAEAGGAADEKRCGELFGALEDRPPTFFSGGGDLTDEEESEAFSEQAKLVFVDSCLSGKVGEATELEIMESGSPDPSESTSSST